MAVSNVDQLAVVPACRASSRLLVWRHHFAPKKLVELLRALSKDAAVDNAKHSDLASNAQRGEVENEERFESRYPQV